MSYTLSCAILGQNTLFLVDIDKTETVGKLKNQIKVDKANVLGSIDADTLTLYQVNISIPDNATFKQAMQDISQNEVHASKEELIHPFSELQDLFEPQGPPRKTIHILVERPPGQSIDSIDPRPCGTVAET